MSQSELLKFVKELLESLGIDYMLTGSLVSSALGEPELTLGIEVLVAVDQANVERLTAGFNPDEFYWSAVAARSAVAGRHMFNVLRTFTGQKIDFYVLPDDAFEQARFARRKPLEVDGVEIMAATAEDIILGKLNWARQLGHSERQFQDALRVYEVNAARLDREYMAAWVERLGLQAIWNRLLQSAEPFNAR
jgi:hypothetical protein